MMLFVAGNEPNSLAARENLQNLCKSTPGFQFELQVVDVLSEYLTALEHNVLVTPSLILVEPGPRVMIVGTLADQEKVRMALRLRFDYGNGHV